MKKLKFNNKLNLKKEEIANLNNIRGGGSSKTQTPDCAITDPNYTNICETNFSCPPSDACGESVALTNCQTCQTINDATCAC